MNRYRDLLTTPGVARLISAQLTARLPSGMISLAYLIHVERIFDSYGLAGLVLAATSFGQAAAGPLTSRWMGRWGMRTVINITLVISIVSMAAIAFLIMPIWGYMLFGLIGGLATPPIQPAVRTIYPKMVTSKQLVPLFSLGRLGPRNHLDYGPGAHHLPRHSNPPRRSPSWWQEHFLSAGESGLSPLARSARFASRPSRGQLGTVLRKGPVLLATITGFLLIGAAAAVEVAGGLRLRR